jgi:ABC-type multidrug transport system permease subunit
MYFLFLNLLCLSVYAYFLITLLAVQLLNTRNRGPHLSVIIFSASMSKGVILRNEVQNFWYIQRLSNTQCSTS